MISSLLWFAGLFYGALLAGWLLRRLDRWSGTIMRSAILAVEAPIFLYSFWVLDRAKLWESLPIPLISAGLIVLSLRWSAVWARRLFPEPAAQGSFVLAAAFSNIGTTGGAFLCYLLFGMEGLGLAYLFLLPYPLLIFTAGFSTAHGYAQGRRLSLWQSVSHLARNTLSLAPLAAIAAGLTLNLSGLRPPAGLHPAADVLIRLDLGVMCLAIGMTLRLRQVFSPWKPVAALGLIKFIGLPLMTLLLVWLVYGSWQPLPARVLLIQSAMPPAIYSVVTANVFGLDRRLVNTLWFSLTLLLLPLAGILFWLFG